MKERSLHEPGLYINRELSWLEFNDRVLGEGTSKDVPLLERLKFLAIVSSNLDEYFMIRVAGLKQAEVAGSARRDLAGTTASETLAAVSARAHRMVARQSKATEAVVAELAAHGLHLLRPGQWSQEQERFLNAYFAQEILPILTPLATENLTPFPTLPGLRLNLALLLRPIEGGQEEPNIAIVPLPAVLARFVVMPAEHGLHMAAMEDVAARHVEALFPGQKVMASALFRITRDGDVAVNDDESDDLLVAVEAAIRDRRRRSVVRLELAAGADERLKGWLVERFAVTPADIYEIEGFLDLAAFMEIALRPGFDKLKNPHWPAQEPSALAGQDDLFLAIQEHDILLAHPYEAFEPVLRLLAAAADDPNVLAIKQTLYRTSGDSPIIRHLARAAESGKQVTVLVELKARFDEAKNIEWARRLEEAGCHVIYGIAGYKTHAKFLLIVRRESHGIRRYVHVSTGNYNEKTARIYSDVGILTADRDIALDASSFFNLLTGYSAPVGWSRIAISPTGLRRRLVELIDREILASSPQEPGLIMAKLNSLEDQGMIEALYRASRAGVKVLLNIRGICCLRPGVKGVSENITVTSIVDRYLEHARIIYFRNGGHDEVYISSADWMVRNLDRRLEILCPVVDAPLRRRLIGMLGIYMADNVKALRLTSEGTYERVPAKKGKRIRAQEEIYQQAKADARAAAVPPTEFRPLRRPKQH